MVDPRHKTVVVVDVDEVQRAGLAEVLRAEGFEVLAPNEVAAAQSILHNRRVDALVADMRTPGVGALGLLDCAASAPDAVVVVAVFDGGDEPTPAVVQTGLRDFLCKPVGAADATLRLYRLLALTEMAGENRTLREHIRRTAGESPVLGESPSIANIRQTIQRLGGSTSNVLICGESGTGKEKVARLIHLAGPSHNCAFVTVHCGESADTPAAEAVRFTDTNPAGPNADAGRSGWFGMAAGGTLFLDEVGALPLASQTALLAEIERRSAAPGAAALPQRLIVRMIASTRRDLRSAVEAGRFLEELFFRLGVVCIQLPPLRKRLDDVRALAEYFVQVHARALGHRVPTLTGSTLEALGQYTWPGNVGELENVLERAIMLADGEPIQPHHLPIVGEIVLCGPNGAMNLRTALREFERRHFIRVLGAVGYNKTAAARALGIGLSSVYRKLEEFHLSDEPDEAFSMAGTRE